MNKPGEITNHLDAEQPYWFAVRTKYRGEKFVEKQLSQKGIQVYLPLLTKTRIYTRKKRTTQQPLISSHIFVKITKKQYVPVLDTIYVYGFIKHGAHLISIPEEEIKVIERIVGSCDEVKVDNDQFEIGTKVEVIGGNLTGLKGQLVRRENKNNFVVRLETMGLQLELTIDPKLLSQNEATATN